MTKHPSTSRVPARMLLPTDITICKLGEASDIAHLHTYAATWGAPALHALTHHLRHPRYHPELTRIATQRGAIVGYALLSHERRRLGTTILEAGRLDHIIANPHDDTLRDALIGDAIGTFFDLGFPLALLHNTPNAPHGFAPYQFHSHISLPTADASIDTRPLRRATSADQDDIAALYDACYRELPLTLLRTAPDWRTLLAHNPPLLILEDQRNIVIGYARLARDNDPTHIHEAAAADAGAARRLCHALLAAAKRAAHPSISLALAPTHPIAQAALHLGGRAHLATIPTNTDKAGIIDTPTLLTALTPELTHRLAHSRYRGWSGTLRIESTTDQTTLVSINGHISITNSTSAADLFLQNVTLPALAQLCLGYRSASDLRATSELTCDDTALGLLDTLFPTLLACE